MGKNAIMPTEPMKVGVNLSNAPYLFIAMLREFKCKMGVKPHIVVLAYTTKLGIEMRWWLEKLISVCAEEECMLGPAFGYPDGSVASLLEYHGILNCFLNQILQEDSNLISEKDNVQALYSLFYSFRKQLRGEHKPPIWTVLCRMP
jgi:hypothetical protein